MRGTGLAILHNPCLKSAGLVTTLVLDFPPPMSTTLYTHSFASDTLSSTSLSLSSTSSSSSRLQPIQQQQELQQETPAVEDQYNTLFCRALYDYVAQDPSALSFRTNDIIEVLTQQPSGWWDGLLGEERGWFPSNYVTIISDEEAELAFSQAENTQ
jgi:son of sevenless-like protein